MNKAFIFTVRSGGEEYRMSSFEKALVKLDSLDKDKYTKIKIEPLDSEADSGQLYVELDAQTFRKTIENSVLMTILSCLG